MSIASRNHGLALLGALALAGGCGDDTLNVTSDGATTEASSTTSSSTGPGTTGTTAPGTTSPTSGESESQTGSTTATTDTTTTTTTTTTGETASTTGVDTEASTSDATTGDTDATTTTTGDTDTDTDTTTGGVELCPAAMEIDGGAVHFGGPSTEYLLGFAVDSQAARWSAGYFFGDINLDPQGNAPKSQIGGGGNMWLSKIDAAGVLEFATAWPGIDGYHSYVWGIAIDDADGATIVGHFVGAIDFDPGPGVDMHVSSGGGGPLDAFMMKFAADGTYQWGVTWGGPNTMTAFDVVRDPADGALVITGYFAGTVDLDPGPGSAMATATGTGNATDGYLLKLDADGHYVWSKTWGAGGVIYSYDLAIAGDGSVAVSGTVEDTVDLDPGAGESLYQSGGSGDTFLARFHADGTWAWGLGVGAEGWDLGNDLAIDSQGDIYLGGGFTSTVVDFDPGPDVAELHNSGSYDVFLLRFLDDGSLVSAQQFASAGHDNLWGLATDCDDDLVIAGHFNSMIDLDPGDGVVTHTSLGNADAFVVRLGSDGAYKWSSSWGGPDYDQAGALAIRPDRMIDVAGRFGATADLDPGAGESLAISNGQTDDFFVTLRPSSGLW